MYKNPFCKSGHIVICMVYVWIYAGIDVHKYICVYIILCQSDEQQLAFSLLSKNTLHRYKKYETEPLRRIICIYPTKRLII